MEVWTHNTCIFLFIPFRLTLSLGRKGRSFGHPFPRHQYNVIPFWPLSHKSKTTIFCWYSPRWSYIGPYLDNPYMAFIKKAPDFVGIKQKTKWSLSCAFSECIDRSNTVFLFHLGKFAYTDFLHSHSNLCVYIFQGPLEVVLLSTTWISMSWVVGHSRCLQPLTIHICS